MLSNKSLTTELRQAFIKLISEKTGIFIRPIDYDALQQKISQRIKVNKQFNYQSYYNFLNHNNYDSQREWQNLVELLTNNESYFFRDQSQFKLLREKLLPELIERQKSERSIRICSAGCSTGQEPYSIAILLKELIHNLNDWNISIIGIDIDKTALQQAYTGIYNAWSFRKVADSVKTKYFDLSNNQYAIKSEYKQLVQFIPVNLSTNTLLRHPKLNNLDLLICRNVFIYFQFDTVAKILNNFWHLLKPEGYLLTGHAELHNQDLSKFNTKVFSESVVYQKCIKQNRKSTVELTDFTSNSSKYHSKLELALSRSINLKSRIDSHRLFNSSVQIDLDETTNLNQTFTSNQNLTPENYSNNKPVPTKIVSESDSKEIINKIETLIAQKSYELALVEIEQLTSQPQYSFKVNNFKAQIYANLGKYDEAKKYAEKAIAIDDFAAEPYYILSLIALENNDLIQAKKLYKKIIYLEPNFISAYLELSEIYSQEHEFKRSKKLLINALNLLMQINPEELILSHGLTASQLITQIETQLNNYYE